MVPHPVMRLPPLRTQPGIILPSEHLWSHQWEASIWWTLLGCSLAVLPCPLSAPDQSAPELAILLTLTPTEIYLEPVIKQRFFFLVLILLWCPLPEGFNCLTFLHLSRSWWTLVRVEPASPPSGPSEIISVSNSKSQIYPTASQEDGCSIKHVLTMDWVN